MKSFATLFLLTCLAATVAVAQPTISYIIPDIGAPGMNTYVEIIGPNSANGNFGSDGLYLNDPTTTPRVEPANLVDTTRIIVGPLVVSWNGKLISTQIFVRPGAANGTVPLRVVTGSGNATVNFEIVTPQVLGPLSGGGALGNGGATGTRSKRGAMIVQDLVINSGAYTVSTSDPDASTPGNQGYLPLIIIAKGQVDIRTGVTISVSGTGKNGGPGGGGGAGEFCDRNPIFSAPSPGTDGGAGYTAGGAGGLNYTLGTSSLRSPGQSTWLYGNSLNNAPGGQDTLSPPWYQGSGGGTGHPFGQGGLASTNSAQNGQYGGGSSNSDSRGGGGGGYGTFGVSASGTSNGGNVHGNIEGVPVAGGSGGGGGNPQFSNAGCAGEGGGGGGGFVLYSMSAFGNRGAISAKGGNGTDPNPSASSGGGGGSGGYVALGAKLNTALGGSGHDVSGGSGGNGAGAGGLGRARADGFPLPLSLPTFLNSVSPYIGVTIDTLTYIDSRTFTLNGTYSGTRQLRIYMRHDYSQWTLLPPATTNARYWTLNYTLPASAPGGNYYFVAMQDVGNPSTGQYTAEPSWVMSQVAANIVQLALIPKFNGQDSLGFKKDIVCEKELFDTVKIWNEGDANLVISNMTIRPNGLVDFSIVSPATPFTVVPGDTGRIVIRFIPQSAGVQFDTLEIAHNDNRAILLSGRQRNPWKVVLRGKKVNIQPSLSTQLLDFGALCKDSVKTLTLQFNYTGEVPGSIQQPITRLGTGPKVFDIIDPTGPKTVNPPSGNVPITVRFQPNGPQAFADSFEITTGPCDSVFILRVRGSGLETKAEVTPNPLDFGDVRVGTTSPTLQALIKNTGGSPGTIIDIFMKPGSSPSFSITNAATLKGSTLGPNATTQADVVFQPTATGAASGQLCVVFGTPGLCFDTVCIDVTGRGVTSLLILSRKQLDLSTDPCLDPSPTVTDTFQLYNRGQAPERILSATSGNPAVVAVAFVPNLPSDLAPGDSIKFTVTWTPGAGNPPSVDITINTQAQDPQQQTLKVTVNLQRNLSVPQVLAEDGSPAPAELTFADAWQCTPPQTIKLRLHNAGTADETFTIGLVNWSTGFTLNLTGPHIIISGGQDSIVAVTFNQSVPSLTPYADTLVVDVANCNRQFRIPMSGNRYEASFTVTPDPVAFGTSNVGIARTGGVTVTNTSISPNNIKLNLNAVLNQTGTEFRIDPAQTFPIQLAPNESETVDIEFTPTAEQPYSAQICFSTENDIPCPVSNCASITGTGVQSSVLVRKSTLNFGTLYRCEIASDTLIIENTGTATLKLLDLVLSGPNAAAFERLTTLTFPVNIQAGSSLKVIYRFTPGNTPNDGLKNATVEVKTDDVAQPSIMVNLVGERRTQLLATPVQLNFGRVVVGTSSDLPLVLENRTAVPLRLDKLILGSPFQIIGFTSPTDIPAFGSITVTVRFTPTDTSYTAATLIASEVTPCIDTAFIPVTGQGRIIQRGAAAIDISDSLTGQPGDRISIPILLRDGQLLAESEATTFVATIRFNKSMLRVTNVRDRKTPLGKAVTGAAVQEGTIESNVTDGEDRVVTFRISNQPLPTAPDTLGFIDATVLLGNDTVTSITIDTLFFTDGEVSVTTEDGIFTLNGYCVIGGDRLIRLNGAFGIKAAAPNPFNPSTELIFETVEDGPTKLTIHDALGRQVATLIDGDILSVGAHRRVWNADLAASGIYYAVLETPTQRSTYRLVLVK